MMLKPTRWLVLLALILWFGMPARGGQVLQTPAGLSPGETFRFVFITDGTISADSSNIATYNSFVNAQANGATYDGSVVNWFAIGSTSSASAINNVGQTLTPVYLVDGTLVTTSTTSTGLWSGSLLNPIDEDVSGALHKGFGTWTGTNSNGSSSGYSLGNFFGVTLGDSSETNHLWVQGGELSLTFLGERMFGISQPLTAVPEPSSLVLGGAAIIGVSAVAWCRKRRDRRR